MSKEIKRVTKIDNKTFLFETYEKPLREQIQQLKQQLEELMLLLSKYEIEEHKPVYCTLAGTECEYLGKVEELKQQLEESFTEEDVEGLIEDRDKTIKFLQKELAEKDKEIERLKVFEKAYYFNQTQVSQESMDLLLQNAYQVHNETQLAIQELEKVKEELDKEIIIMSNFDDMKNQLKYLVEISVYIQQRLKKLKGK